MFWKNYQPWSRSVVQPARDEIDDAILRELQADGRLANADLARRIGLSQAATHARVRRLERDGVIAGYVALVDREQAGFDLLCFVNVSLRAHRHEDIERFKAAVIAMPEVLEVHHVTGEHDYVLRVALHNRRDLERFLVDRLSLLAGIARIQTSLVLREVKRTTALPIGTAPGATAPTEG
jgi:Lrp/AsnC family transcriptional regulator, leucine-responsive regulatory protein